MRTVVDWLEDWLAEHRNVRLEDAHPMANAVRAAALADGYSLELLRDAGDGDIERFVGPVVVSQVIAGSTVAPLEGTIGRV